MLEAAEQAIPMDGDMDALLGALSQYRFDQIPDDLWAELPMEVRDALERQEAQRKEQLDILAKAVTRHRDEAITARRASGIEDEWEDDQDAYEGIDDANRGESVRDRRRKPAMDQRYDERSRRKGANRSTVFLNITGPYTDAAAARMSEMLLPSDDQPYSIEPTPDPELNALTESAEVAQDEQGNEQSVAELAKAEQKKAREKAKRAERRITDWLTEGQWHGEVRAVIEDAAKLGTGVLKGPIPELRRYRAAGEVNGSVALVMDEQIAPVSKRVDPWNCYPDPAAGEDIQDGRYFIERDWITPKQLKELADDPQYLDDQIRECLLDGPDKRVVQDNHEEYSYNNSLNEKFEIWYYYGTLSSEQLEAAEADLTDYSGDTELTPAVITVVNDRVIKASLSHLESGEYPYDFMCWRARKGLPWGSGVPRHIRVPQRMLNAATRQMMDNSGLSAIPQFVSKKGIVTPVDGSYQLYAGKHWHMSEDTDIDDVRKAFTSVHIDSRQQELMNIIQYATKMAEDVTGLPQIMQGNQGSAPDTVGGMQILNNNANSVLRRLAKAFDDGITEPHLRRYYEWLMLYGESEDEKGDYTVDAKGSGALVEREIQNQAIVEMGQLVQDPRFGIDPQKWFKEMAKAQRLNPESFMLDEDEQRIPPEVQEKIKELQEKLAEYEQDAQKEKIRAQAQLQGKQIDAQTKLQTTQMEIQSENRQAGLKAQQDQRKAELDAQIAQQKVQIEQLDKQLEKQTKDDANAIKVAELRLQRAALEHQIAQARQQQAQAEVDRAERIAHSVNTGSKTGVMRRDDYGSVPHAEG